MIIMQFVLRTTLNTLTTVALPDFELDPRRDNPQGCQEYSDVKHPEWAER